MNSVLLLIAAALPNDAESDARAALALAAASVPEVQVGVPIKHDYRWVRGDDPDQIHLFDGKVQIGTFRYDQNGQYHPYDDAAETWGKALPYGAVPLGAPYPPAKLSSVQPAAFVRGRSC